MRGSRFEFQHGQKRKKYLPIKKGLMEKLIHLSLTRPDNAFLVGMVSQFMNNPTGEHMEVVHHILRYLKMTPRKGLCFIKT